MSLFSTPEEHDDNPPETWVVSKLGDGLWSLTTSDGINQVGSFATKKLAYAGKTDSWQTRLYETESRWYAGASITGWRPWVEVRADRARLALRQAEKADAAGASVSASW